MASGETGLTASSLREHGCSRRSSEKFAFACRTPRSSHFFLPRGVTAPAGRSGSSVTALHDDRDTCNWLQTNQTPSPSSPGPISGGHGISSDPLGRPSSAVTKKGETNRPNTGRSVGPEFRLHIKGACRRHLKQTIPLRPRQDLSLPCAPQMRSQQTAATS